jgi:acyl-CoA synthetase (AMP-forming)/AMP-acid ligase II
MLAGSARRFAERVAVADGDVSLSYPELAALVRRATRALLALGLAREDRVAVWAPNLWEWVVAALATHEAGATLVPINTRFKGGEAAAVLSRSRARVLFTVTGFLGTDYVELLSQAGARLPEHVVILRPAKRGILLHTMYYVDEIRQVDEFRTDTSQVREKELELAKALINSLAEDFHPEKYHDTYRANVQKMIEDKIQGKKVVETPAPQLAPVVDIMEALRRSLAEKRKPAQAAATSTREEEQPAAAPKKRTRRKAS